ncbi:hypothetical protein ACS7SF_23220 (plasmid) [Ralstonia sp. 25C]|uniref:hypothetical protein n=1 Tax=Ralstonia sp. 25C TaxID=3447363 RepID=UPI003F74D751
MTRGRPQTLIPSQFALIEWPLPSQATLLALSESKRQLYIWRKQVVDMARDCQPFATIERQKDLSRAGVRWLVTLCLETAPDGQIKGYRALVPGAFRKEYERVATVTSREGAAGAWRQLLKDIPGLDVAIKRLVFFPEGCEPDQLQTVTLGNVWSRFLQLLREAGRTDADYPLFCLAQGQGALYRHILKLKKEHPGRIVRLRRAKVRSHQGEMSEMSGSDRPNVLLCTIGHIRD